MITITQKGDFRNLVNFLQKAKKIVKLSDLDKYGEMGVKALMEATPVRTGRTAASWYYKTSIRNNVATLEFHNSNIQNGENIALILDLGHGSKQGYWIEGRDYIAPALEPVFEQILEDAWNELNT